MKQLGDRNKMGVGNLIQRCNNLSKYIEVEQILENDEKDNLFQNLRTISYSLYRQLNLSVFIFLQVSHRKIQNLISRGPTKSGESEISFGKNPQRRLFMTKE